MDAAGAGMFQRIVDRLLNNAQEVFRDGPSETHGSSPGRKFHLGLGAQAAVVDQCTDGTYQIVVYRQGTR